MPITQVALSRRHFMLASLATGLSFNPINSLAANSLTRLSPYERKISLYNTHTSEQVNICYYSDGAYQKDSLNTLNHLLRDHRTDDSYNMDIQLFDTLNIIQMRLDCHQPFHIISGYRSKKTNNMLRKRSGKVAKKSYHMQGRAIDVRLPGKVKSLYKVAKQTGLGGVGRYDRSGFVHLDTGPIRAWS